MLKLIISSYHRLKIHAIFFFINTEWKKECKNLTTSQIFFFNQYANLWTGTNSFSSTIFGIVEYDGVLELRMGIQRDKKLEGGREGEGTGWQLFRSLLQYSSNDGAYQRPSPLYNAACTSPFPSTESRTYVFQRETKCCQAYKSAGP
jgi:hypothetical protein